MTGVHVSEGPKKAPHQFSVMPPPEVKGSGYRDTRAESAPLTPTELHA